MKLCSSCKTEKPFKDFSLRKASRDGYAAACKACVSTRRKAYKSEKLYNKNYYEVNKESLFQRKEAWYKANPAKKSEHRQTYRLKNLERVRFAESLKHTKRRTRVPRWLTETQKQEIQKIYSLRREAEMLTGEKYHVDHIIPLQGKDVCGLHVPWNLQVLPSDVNLSKHNKLYAEQGFTANTGEGVQ